MTAMTFEMAMAQAFLTTYWLQNLGGRGNYAIALYALRRLRVRAGLTP